MLCSRSTIGAVVRTLYGILNTRYRGDDSQLLTRLCMCVCVFIKMQITAQSGPVILVILCYSLWSSQGGINGTYTRRYFQHSTTTSYQQWVWEREAHINWSMVTCQGSTRYWTYLEVYWSCASGLSAVNVIGMQLRDTINSGLTRWRMAVLINKWTPPRNSGGIT